jgi:hypothetical protein
MFMKSFGFQNHRLPSVGMEWWKLERSVIVAGRRIAGTTAVSHSAGPHHLKNLLADSLHTAHAAPHR